ncbi:hypothetical protein JTE90_026660 [Oedothorax gibbosus]|uniref:ATP-dependent DNA helicase n=1 Tax=Oedothorax gibbosus TaxID=931172 RepID=A0AAV6TS69_9ARAC|nr:hypothetical protein JTE90_026660 [Oedothorax gibbosus]
MIPRKALEIIDRTLKNVMNNSLPFGGKTFILGGDFKQVLPVVKKPPEAKLSRSASNPHTSGNSLKLIISK